MKNKKLKKEKDDIFSQMVNFGTRIFKDENVAKHLSFGVGGKVKYLAEVCNQEEIIFAVNLAREKKIPYLILGGGYNLVFSGKKWNGIVIKVSDGKIKINGDIIYSDAGALLSGLIKVAVSSGLSGIETLSGIPGTIGGAIYGNAGAYGHSISEYLVSVTIFDGNDVRKIAKDECDFSYRESIFKKKDWVILGAEFKFIPGDRGSLTSTSKKIIETRLNKFGKEPKCAGSYFKNVVVSELKPVVLEGIPKNKIIDGKIPAGYLLESVGAKGMRVGGIYVADYHGNIILNDGTGKSSDLYKLTEKLKKLVKEKFGINLEEEVITID